MRLVERAVTFPSRCAAIPFIGVAHEAGYVDTGAEIPASAKDSHVYVSVVAVREMASLIGYVSGEEHGGVVAERDELRDHVTRLEAEVAEADRVLKAIDVFESEGFRARKKTGRPPKEQVA